MPPNDNEFDDAPSEQLSSSGTPSGERPPSTPKVRWSRLAIVLLTTLVLIIGLLLVLRHRSTPEARTGSATLRGQVVNTQSKGSLDAVVYVEGMQASVTTDDSGTFSIGGVPDGQQVLVVGVTPEALHFVTVSVKANATQDVGPVVYQTAPK